MKGPFSLSVKTLNNSYSALLTKQIIPFHSDYLTEKVDFQCFDGNFKIEAVVIPREIDDPVNGLYGTIQKS